MGDYNFIKQFKELAMGWFVRCNIEPRKGDNIMKSIQRRYSEVGGHRFEWTTIEAIVCKNGYMDVDVIDANMDDVHMIWNNDDRYDGDIGLGKLSTTIMMMLIKTLMQSMT